MQHRAISEAQLTAKKLISVVGATGAQGGGLARSILADAAGEFAVRALTRKADGEPARALAAAGAEVVVANLDDEDSLRHAFQGAHGAFCVTNFWEHASPERELAQAAAMARAAAAAGLQHVVWSTLEDTRRFVPLDDERMPTLMGKYKVPHFDAKGEADHCFVDAGVPTTCLLSSFYWENLISFGMGPKPAEDGVLEWTLPLGSARFPGIAVEDIGRCAHGIFRRGADEMAGRYVGVAGDQLTGDEMAAAMSAAFGRTVRYRAVAPALYRSLGFPGAEDLGNMFQFNAEFAVDVCRSRDIALSRALNPSLQSFAQWLQVNGPRIPQA
jgi:uncharacterized protein YbjT (DUF2867 family)